MRSPSSRLFLFLLALAIAGSPFESAEAASPLGNYRLSKMSIRGKVIRPVPDSEITLSLESANRCSGNSGVNRYFGECRIIQRRGRIQFPSGLASTRMAGPPELMRQEFNYLKYLVASKRYQLKGGRLLLKSRNQRVELRFRRTS